MEKPLRAWASPGPSWAPSESTAFRLYSAAMGEQAEDEHGRRLDDDQIIDILIMYLSAGHESPATSPCGPPCSCRRIPTSLQRFFRYRHLCPGHSDRLAATANDSVWQP